MIFEASEFEFKAPPIISRARRVLIKPCSPYPIPYPATTSPEMLAIIIEGIRAISDADVILLEGTATGEPVDPIYKKLGYEFPRVLTLDVKDCVWVEVDNPLPKALIVPTFWVPNVIISSDYLISVAPLKLFDSRPSLTIDNLLTLLPSIKYRGEAAGGWGTLYGLGIEKALADLYFTLPFDLGIIEARQKYTVTGDLAKGGAEEYGKIFVGEPYEVDREVCEALGLRAEHLDLIKSAKVGLET